MPLYAAGAAPSIQPGQSVLVSASSLGTTLKTQAVAVAPSPGTSDVRLTVTNLSGVTLTVQYAPPGYDADANYQSYSDEVNAVTVGANKAVSFYSNGGFFRLLAASDPGTANIIVSR